MNSQFRPALEQRFLDGLGEETLAAQFAKRPEIGVTPGFDGNQFGRVSEVLEILLYTARLP